MKPGHLLFVIFAAPLGILLGTRVATAPAEPAGLICADKKLVAYGYTHPQVSFAEMAAIVTWQLEAKETAPGMSEWHLARKRTMKCRLFRKSNHYQCVLSATPCRMERS